jgi:hypothetical protein
MREVARERQEMRRKIMGSSSRAEAERHFRRGVRDIERERREARREIRREFRREARRRYYGRVVAGVVLGTVISAAVANQVPRPPSPDLCWYWSGSTRISGYWYYCNDDYYYD